VPLRPARRTRALVALDSASSRPSRPEGRAADVRSRTDQSFQQPLPRKQEGTPMNTTDTMISHTHRDVHARVVQASKKARFEIERDVLRGRSLTPEHKFLPDGLSLAPTLPCLDEAERRFMSQVQGRTYANLFGLVERFINAKVLELSHEYFFADQTALESLVRFSDEELKHQELFRRVERLAAHGMPEGYSFDHDPNQVAAVVLSKSSWAVLALTCHIELFTLAHYKKSIEPDVELSPLWKDIFMFHWKEESQHAVLDEIEWRRADQKLGALERDAAVNDLIALVVAVDGILVSQASADVAYFLEHGAGPLTADERAAVHATFVRAYRYQYLFSGLESTRFAAVLFELITPDQRTRIETALATLH
jgi:hypothetical protein